MSKKKVVPLFKETVADEVAQTLLDASDANFDEVIVIGKIGNDYAFMRSGVTMDDWLKNLELAKGYLQHDYFRQVFDND